MRSKLHLTFVMLPVLLLVGVANAEMRIQVQVLGKSKNIAPTTMPTTAPSDDQLTSVITGVNQDQKFFTSVVIDNRTIKLEGSLRPDGAGAFFVKIAFSDNTGTAPGFVSTMSTTTNIRASVDQPITIGGFGLQSGPMQRKIVLTLKSEDKP